MITLKEIAELANVSRGTVDKVIHNRAGVSEETKAKVNEIIKQQGYEPSKAGQLLAGLKKEIRVAIISVFSEEKEYFSMVRSGMDLAYDELKQYGFYIKYFYVEKNREDVIFKVLSDITKENYNAIVLPPYNSQRMRDYLLNLSNKGVSIATYSTDILDAKRLFFVGNDYYKSGRTAAALMARSLCGKGNIVMFQGDDGIKCHQDRSDGFLDYVAENYPDIHVIHKIPDCDDDLEAYFTMRKILGESKDLRGIFIVSRGISGIVSAVKELEVSARPCIVTFDIYKNTKTHLENGEIDFVVDQGPLEQGKMIINTLFNYLFFGKEIEDENIYTPMSIYIKENI